MVAVFGVRWLDTALDFHDVDYSTKGKCCRGNQGIKWPAWFNGAEQVIMKHHISARRRAGFE